MTMLSWRPATGLDQASSKVGLMRQFTERLAFLIIGISSASRALIAFEGSYLVDDFVIVARMSKPDALDPSSLFELHVGHLMPAAHLLTWILNSLAPWNFALLALVMAAGWLACLVLMYKLLTAWLGTTPMILVPLTAYAITPLTVQASTWWAAAINAIPLQLCALGGCLLLLPFARGAVKLSVSRQLAVVFLQLVAMSFFSKAVLLSILFMGVSWAWARGDSLQAARSVVRGAPLVAATAVVAPLSYGIAYIGATVGQQSTPGLPDPVAIVHLVAQGFVAAIVPTFAGGPISFSSWGLFAGGGVALPPPWVVGFGTLILGGTVVLVLVGRSPETRRFAIVCGVYAIACLSLIVAGRVGFGPSIAGMLRYYADLAIPATLLLASLCAGALANGTQRNHATRWVFVVVLILASGAVSITTTLTISSDPEAKGTKEVALRTLETLANERASTILDMAAPGVLVWPGWGEYAQSSVLFAKAPSTAKFAPQAESLRIWSADGRLLTAHVAGPQATGECRAGRSKGQSLTLEFPTVPWYHVADVTTVAPRPTQVRISIGGGPARVWEIPAGTARMYAHMQTGPTRSVLVSPLDKDAEFCVVSVRVGNVVPSEATN